METELLEEIKNITKECDEIQKKSLDIYGKYDIDKSIVWMTEEFGEVVAAIRKGKSKEETTGEFGDLLAWIFALANNLEIKISDAISGTFEKEINRQLKKYGKLKYKTK